MLTKMTAFLARAPALQGLSLTVGDVGPAPYTAGLWCRGITVLDRRENLLGRVTQRCRAEFTLRLCLPRTDADNAARLLDLQTWAAAESAAGRGPVLGNAGRTLRLGFIPDGLPAADGARFLQNALGIVLGSVPPPPLATVPVPTLSQWSLGALAVLMSLAMFRRRRSRQ